MLEKLFKLRKWHNVRTEIIAGITTFLTIYIIFVNPAMLADAGMDKGRATPVLLQPLDALSNFVANYDGLGQVWS